MHRGLRRNLVLLPVAVALLGAPAVALASQSRQQAASELSTSKRSSTLACLKRKGAVVGPVMPVNRHMQALHDLAQRISVQVRIRRALVGMAFERTTSGAVLLVSLLESPNNPYRLDRRAKIVVLSPKSSPDARTAVLACL
jgi:hypothetical protein